MKKSHTKATQHMSKVAQKRPLVQVLAKVIAYKSCSELSLLVQCIICTYLDGTVLKFHCIKSSWNRNKCLQHHFCLFYYSKLIINSGHETTKIFVVYEYILNQIFAWICFNNSVNYILRRIQDFLKL